MDTHGEKSSEGHSPTPEPGTPDFVNVFTPDRVVKSPLDGSGCSNEKSTDTPGTVAYMPVAKDSPLYNMNHKHRGKCIVFNHENPQFERSIYRDCSSVDASRIKQTFKKLGFDVEILKDLEYEKMMEKIIELSEANHEDSDCICIFMLTHGSPDESDKNVICGDNEIWKPFAGDNCKTLVGKPKLFFFQTCRGAGDVFYPNALEIMDAEANPFSYTIPIYADFLISHSTVTGFCFWGNVIEGKWFIQCLCDVLDQYANTTDLLKMLTITARKAAAAPSFDFLVSNSKQVPSTMSMLLRDVYFTPKQEYSSDRSDTQ